MGTGNETIKQTYDMCVNLIGDSLDQFLFCISNDTCESFASERTEKKSIYDYWDFIYNRDLIFMAKWQ